MLKIHRVTYCLYYIFQSCVHLNSVVYQTENKNTEKVDISEETDLFRISQKSHFPKWQQMLKIVLSAKLRTNQRTSGPVNAHLTPGPGIYFNAFIHVYRPRGEADNPFGTNVDVNRKPLSLSHLLQLLKQSL